MRASALKGAESARNVAIARQFHEAVPELFCFVQDELLVMVMFLSDDDLLCGVWVSDGCC